MEIPNDLLQVIQDLLLDLRVHCLMVTLLHTTEGERGQALVKSCRQWAEEQTQHIISFTYENLQQVYRFQEFPNSEL